MSSQVSSGWIARLISPVLAVPHVAFAIGLACSCGPVVGLLDCCLHGSLVTGANWMIGDPLGLDLMIGLLCVRCHFGCRSIGGGRGLAFNKAWPWVKAQGLVRPKAGIDCYGLNCGPAWWPLVLVLAYGLTNVDMALVLGQTPANPCCSNSQSLAILTRSVSSSSWSAGFVNHDGLAIGGILLLLQGRPICRVRVYGPWGRWHGYWLAISRLLGALVGWLIPLVMLFGFAATLLFVFSDAGVPGRVA